MSKRYALSLLLALCVPAALLAQSAETGRNARALITRRIDEGQLHRLQGNTRPEANPQNDRGRVADSLPLDHMLLQLQRSPAQEQAVQAFLDELQEPGSPNFHKWLSPTEFGDRFGASQTDIDAITAWLGSHGFTVNSVYPNGMIVDFSGTAGQVASTFHTEIHDLDVNGRAHIANMSDPQIPDALAPVVAGVVSLHDFSPRPMSKARGNYTYVSGSQTLQAVVPADLATIYNLNPLFSAGISGQGQTIAVVEDTDLYISADWTTFRTEFGLSKYTAGSLATVHPAPPSGKTNCSDPGVPSGGDDGEAILDAEWASAAAPSAAIQVASCSNSRTTFGGLIAVQNLVSATKPPSVISMSYGECEAENGASANASYSSAFQQAAAEGISDWNSTNTSAYGSAKSYIPEIPWNDSCAGALLAKYLGYTTVYGASGFCNSSTTKTDGLQAVAGGSGGPSGCATGSPSVTGVVGGTCKGYAKPSWQTALTPADSVRDIPDVSLFAANGVWGHYYVYCWSNVRAGGAKCTGAPSAWAGAGGTSFSSPILAAIQALVDQHAGALQGNPNPVYYRLAAASPATCNSSLGNAVSAACVFYNVTEGDNDVNCGGSVECYGSTTTTSGGRRPVTTQLLDGALSTSSAGYTPAYKAASGWNFATGIGTVNAYNLVMGW